MELAASGTAASHVGGGTGAGPILAASRRGAASELEEDLVSRSTFIISMDCATRCIEDWGTSQMLLCACMDARAMLCEGPVLRNNACVSNPVVALSALSGLECWAVPFPCNMLSN